MTFDSLQDLVKHFEGIQDAIDEQRPRMTLERPYPSRFKSMAAWGKKMDAWRAEHEKFKEAKLAYQQVHENSHLEYLAALAEYLHISTHPKREKLLSMAWERGHGIGLSEVAIEAEELSQLIMEDKS